VFFKMPPERYLGCNRAYEEFIGLPREKDHRQDHQRRGSR